LKSIITLTTDFGTRDGYAAAVKGVILSINPQAQIAEVTHEIPADNILAGAFCIHNFCPFFPPGAIHLAVVDPGVGGKRKAVLVQSEKYLFIGPDNGIFDLALKDEQIERVIELANPKYRLQSTSSTFQGRDIFAPAAAYLSLGVSADEFGPKAERRQRLNFPEVKIETSRIIGQVIYIDNFGNLISNIRTQLFEGRQIKGIQMGKLVISNLSRTYSAVAPGETMAYIGSSGFLELGSREDRASSVLSARVGDRIEVLL
jgi:S-adenosylmethionine hydrolase